MINKVLDTIKEYNLIEDNDKIVLGVSGGVDSMTLLYILSTLKKEGKINFDFSVVTCDHNTRDGESTSDALFVKEECDKLGVKVYTYEIDLEKEAKENKISSEEMGRKFRYNAFNDALKKEGANKIATAHNMDDNAETVLLNIFRGTGLDGLCGIPVKNGKVIRPLIKCSKEEIYNFAKVYNIEYREDKTNKEEDFTRNKIRNKIIPFVKENINQSILSQVNNMTETLEVEKDFIHEETIKAFNEVATSYIESDESNNENKDVIKLDIDKLNNYHLAIKKRVIKKAISLINNDSIKDLSNKHIESVIDILKKGTGKQITVLNSILCKVNYDYLLITKGEESKNELEKVNENSDIIILETKNNSIALYDNKSNDLTLSSNESVKLNDEDNSITFKISNKEIVLKSLNDEENNSLLKLFNEDKNSFNNKMKDEKEYAMYFDLDKVLKKTNIISNEESLEKISSKVLYRFRQRDDGDKILIDNENHYKSISDIFIDEKIERDNRNKYIIFEKIEKDENDNVITLDIISILGLRTSPKYMITNDTKNIMKVMFDTKK